MEKLAVKIQKLFSRGLPGSRVVLNTPEKDRRLSGFVVWSGFRRVEQISRQRRVYKLLRENLTDAERSRVSHLFTLTPNEWASYTEDRHQEEEAILHTAATIRRERAKRRRFLAGLKAAG